ncbi:solute carrier family 35 member f5 [Anaeramoeba flamelloides]|uniref:Solute carrier family 35 member f5 n=1 Tax=Anaeramoeba flamelloides TaxID=1746091 RepID=A0ABQ8YWN9_9EUKA|nr:solute carrier family 35 member f5 [Anaeramoeba flamelloides]
MKNLSPEITPSEENETEETKIKTKSNKKTTTQRQNRKKQRLRYILGLFCILLVVIFWVTSSLLMSYMYKDVDYNKPFFLTYFNTILFSFPLFGFIFIPSWKIERGCFSSVLKTIKSVFQSKCKRKKSQVKKNRPIKDEFLSVKPLQFGNVSDSKTDDLKKLNLNQKEKENKNNENIHESENTKEYENKTDNESKTDNKSENEREDNKENLLNDDCEKMDTKPLLQEEKRQKNEKTNEMYTVAKLIKIAMVVSPIWFFANYFFNLSLSYTSVASNTIFTNTAGFFTLFLGIILKTEKFSPLNFLSVFFCLVGVIFVAYSDINADEKSTVYGDIITLVSSVCYGFYPVAIFKLLTDTSKFKAPMFLSIMGLVSLLYYWPLFFILEWTGLETFAWPSLKIFGMLSINAIIGSFLCDYVFTFSVFLTSPLVSTLGLNLTIPLAMVAQRILKQTHYKTLYIIGAISVIIGFCIVNLAKKIEEYFDTRGTNACSCCSPKNRKKKFLL